MLISLERLAITAGLPIAATDVALSVLPLSHIFERTGFYIFCYNGVVRFTTPPIRPRWRKPARSKDRQ